MSQDPYSGYGNNPNNPYGVPQNPYQQQPNPYQPQPQPNPYGTPSQPQPQPNPYGVPPQPQPPYGAPGQPPYGAPGYNPYGYSAPITPLPPGQAISQLPEQYQRVVLHPGTVVATFEAEMPKAAWDIVWIQLGIWTVSAVVIGIITSLLSSAVFATANLGALGGFASYATASAGIGSAFAEIVLVPAAFFLVAGAQFALSKMFGGQGTFLHQAYTSLLFVVPLAGGSFIIARILEIIPVAGSILAILIELAALGYMIALNIPQIRVSQRLTTGKAAWVVFIPWIIVAVLFLCALAIVIIAAIGAASQQLQY